MQLRSQLRTKKVLAAIPAVALVVSGAGAIPAPEARKWMRGRELLDGQDPYVFALQMPRSDFTAFVEQHPEVVERIQRSAPYPKEQK